MSRRARVTKLEGWAHGAAGVIVTTVYPGEDDVEAWAKEHGDREAAQGALLVFIQRFSDTPRPAQ